MCYWVAGKSQKVCGQGLMQRIEVKQNSELYLLLVKYLHVVCWEMNGRGFKRPLLKYLQFLTINDDDFLRTKDKIGISLGKNNFWIEAGGYYMV